MLHKRDLTSTDCRAVWVSRNPPPHAPVTPDHILLSSESEDCSNSRHEASWSVLYAVKRVCLESKFMVFKYKYSNKCIFQGIRKPKFHFQWHMYTVDLQ